MHNSLLYIRNGALATRKLLKIDTTFKCFVLKEMEVSVVTSSEERPKKEKMEPYVEMLFTSIRSDNYDQIMNILMVESLVNVKDARNKHGETVFMAAAKHGNTHVLNMLTDIVSVSTLGDTRFDL